MRNGFEGTRLNHFWFWLTCTWTQWIREKGKTLVTDKMWLNRHDGRSWENNPQTKKKNTPELSFKLGAIHLEARGSSPCDCEYLSQSFWMWKLIYLPLYTTLPLNAPKCLSGYTFSLCECNLNGLSKFFLKATKIPSIPLMYLTRAKWHCTKNNYKVKLGE